MTEATSAPHRGIPPDAAGAATDGDGADRDKTIVLNVVGLTTTFETPRGHVRAVRGVDLQLRRGETLGIVGESGSGKTVLSRSIMGLLPRSGATRGGRVLLNGQDLSRANPRQLRKIMGRDISMIFQDPMTSLHPVMTIGSQITETLRLHLPMSRREAKQRAVELLRSVKIPSPEQRVGQYPHELSGGMRQRVMIAIALACNPSVLIADEPTTALDVTVQAHILDLLAEQQRERHGSMILISHDLGLIATRCTRIAVMYAGSVVEEGPTAALFERTRMHYTRALLESTPHIEGERGVRLRTIDGRPPDLAAPPVGCAFAARCGAAQEKCRKERPPLQRDASAPGHRFACWYPIDSDHTQTAQQQVDTPAPVLTSTEAR